MSEAPAAGPRSEVAIRLRGVCRHYGGVRAVDGVDLDIRAGEFFAMLGPSGSGKTTCLRRIAGFDEPTAGSIELHGQPVVGVPPYARDVNTVFQDYALFPHMPVGDNVAYGLMVKGVPRRERTARMAEMLALVHLSGYEGRRPAELCELVQGELKALQRNLGVTFVYVSHDQGEALTMSDPVAVFARGRVEQVAAPADLYLRPATEFVASFVGASKVVKGALAERLFGRSGRFSLRPEHVRLTPLAGEPLPGARAEGVVEDVQFLGTHARCEVEVGGERLVAHAPPGAVAPGQRVALSWEDGAPRPIAVA